MCADLNEQLFYQTLHYVLQGYGPEVATALARNDLRLWDWPDTATRDPVEE